MSGASRKGVVLDSRKTRVRFLAWPILAKARPINRLRGMRSRYLQEEEVTAHLPAVRMLATTRTHLKKYWWNTHSQNLILNSLSSIPPIPNSYTSG